MMAGRQNEWQKAPRPGVRRLLRRDTAATAGLAVLAVIITGALLAPVLPLPDPDKTDLAQRLLRPFVAGHLLGTDHLGRDILARLLWGARVSLAIAVAATALSAIIGSALALVAAFAGRWIDTAVMRSVDTLMAFPYMLLALAIVAVLGPGLLNALIAVAIVNIPFFARTVRGTAISEVAKDYVAAARLSGLSGPRIVVGEVLPNVMPTIVITFATTVGWMILETAGLSFLGLGAQPPRADLGSMLGEGRKLFIIAPHVAAVPGIAILVLAIAVNVVADGVRDALDPRLKAGTLARPAAATEVDSDGGEPSAPATSTDPEPVLSVTGLKTWFHDEGSIVKAVDGVDFAIAPGECLGIVGESGSGKSVMALSLLRLVPTPPGRIVAGRAFYRGTSLLEADFATLRGLRGGRISYVFQDPARTLHPMKPVGKQIVEAIRAHQQVSSAQARRRAVAMLEAVRIPEPEACVGALPHELSGGQQQRVVIAIALANDPDILIADEPTTALDVTTQAEVLRLLDRLRRERRLSLLFVSHDFGVISEMCDRVAVMRQGEFVEIGTTEDVIQSPRFAYTQTLIEVVPRLGAGTLQAPAK